VATNYETVLERVERVLAPHRGAPHSPSPREIDDVYTDACATILTLESERAELDRALTSLLEEDGDDPAAVKQARELARRREDVGHELAALRALAASLSTAAEWARDPMYTEARDLTG
jgi:hypothetical protein